MKKAGKYFTGLILLLFLAGMSASATDEGFVYSQEGKYQGVEASRSSRRLVKMDRDAVDKDDQVHLDFSVRLAAEVYTTYGLSLRKLEPVTIYPYLEADGLNAHFDPNDNSLNFHVYPTRKGLRYTCHSLDIVTHETGHWLLHSKRPDITTSKRPQTGALNESFGDLTSIFVRACNKIASPSKDSPALCLASDIGECIRDARNTLTIGLLLREQNACEVHSLSRVFTGAMFTAFEESLNSSNVPTRTLNDFARLTWLSFTNVESDSPSLPDVAVLAINQSDLKATRGYLAKSFLQRGILFVTPTKSLACNAFSCSVCDDIIVEKETT
ncbi:MAG: hypothetical protein K2Q34_03770 [Alphaproteobacteria bacterium]|nr:hypothetical protein [Alphaproteobacteria bacterium]